MTFAAASSSALAAIHATFATASISWRRDGEVAVACTGVPLTDHGDPAFGGGGGVVQRGFEVRKGDLPFEPANGDLLIVADAGWRVIHVIDYPHIGAWRVYIEEAE